MTSKLFHTVVGFGITLGAMSIGCSAAPADGSESSEAAQTSYGGGADVSTSTDATAPPVDLTDKDRFCEVAWPTTKGGPRPAKAQPCTDPAKECGVYPGGIFSNDTCTESADVNSCDGLKPEIWKLCKTTATGSHAWACPAGTIAISSCNWPQPAPEAEATK